jgi:xanthine/uracil permease
VKNIINYFYMVVVALWVGGMASFTFVMTPRIFSHYDRDAAGQIVGALIPVYFPYNFALSVLTVVLLLVMWRGWTGHAHRISVVLAILAAAIALYVLFMLYPDIMEIKRQVTSFVDMPPDMEPRASFRRLHALSAMLNLTQLLIGMILLYLGRLFCK